MTWLTDQMKMDRIRAICDHPGTFHWTGQQVGNAIRTILDEKPDLHYELVGEVLDVPIPYEIVDDAEPMR